MREMETSETELDKKTKYASKIEQKIADETM